MVLEHVHDNEEHTRSANEDKLNKDVDTAEKIFDNLYSDWDLSIEIFTRHDEIE